MQLVLLAAGRGARLKSKTKKIPKCLVKVSGKPIINYNNLFFKKFKKKIAVIGYKSLKLRKYLQEYNFLQIYNKKFLQTNMVESMFLAKEKITEKEIVFVYSDIVFKKTIFENLKSKYSFLLLNTKWEQLWKKRMGDKFTEDAETVVVKGKFISSIGEKIKKGRVPPCQYMGIFKLMKKDYLKLYSFYKIIKNKKIDFTSFINLAIKKEVIDIKYKLTSKLWLEVDNSKDIKIAEKFLTGFYKW